MRESRNRKTSEGRVTATRKMTEHKSHQEKGHQIDESPKRQDVGGAKRRSKSTGMQIAQNANEKGKKKATMKAND